MTSLVFVVEEDHIIMIHIAGDDIGKTYHILITIASH